VRRVKECEKGMGMRTEKGGRMVTEGIEEEIRNTTGRR